jgi:hypothetical protein
MCMIAASSRATDRRPLTLIFGLPATEWYCGHLCCPSVTVVNHLREVIACKKKPSLFYRLGSQRCFVLKGAGKMADRSAARHRGSAR